MHYFQPIGLFDGVFRKNRSFMSLLPFLEDVMWQQIALKIEIIFLKLFCLSNVF